MRGANRSRDSAKSGAATESRMWKRGGQNGKEIAMRRAVLMLLFLAAGLFSTANAAERPVTTVSKAIAGVDGQEWNVVMVELGPGASDARHFHPGLELVYVLEGAGSLHIAGDPPVSLNPGRVAALPQKRAHVVTNTSRTHALKVLVVFSLKKAQHNGAEQPAIGDRAIPDPGLIF